MAGVPPGEPEEAEVSHAGAPTSIWQIELHVTGNIISCYLSQKHHLFPAIIHILNCRVA